MFFSQTERSFWFVWFLGVWREVYSLMTFLPTPCDTSSSNVKPRCRMANGKIVCRLSDLMVGLFFFNNRAIVSFRLETTLVSERIVFARKSSYDDFSELSSRRKNARLHVYATESTGHASLYCFRWVSR